MSPTQWILLCTVFSVYLLAGGCVFMVLEQHHEIHHNEEMTVLKQDIQEILLRLDRDFYRNETSKEVLDALQAAKEGVIKRISDVCGGDDLLDQTAGDADQVLKWNFYNSVFFAFTVITTIGYGHLSPTTNWSKSFTMVYALVGIPINGILLANLGEYFSSKMVKVHRKSKEKKYEHKFTLILEIIFYLIPGVVVFLVIPAGIFVFIENWTFLDAIYFCFVTLTTIGFGDYVAGMGDGSTVWRWIYKVAIIIWIIIGLGYLVMILGFITKGLKSKKVRVVIERRLHGIRSTKDKLSKDVEYMRRVVNELYLLKIKPIYDEGHDHDSDDFKMRSQRTQSDAAIMFARTRRYSSLPRLRQQPVGIALPSPMVARRNSDTELHHINKEKTFEKAMEDRVSPEELLCTVVRALSGNVMTDVIDAVDEMNGYVEEKVFVPEDTDIDNLDADKILVIEEYDVEDEESSGGFDANDGALRHDVETGPPPWELGMLKESDEDVLIVGDPKHAIANKQIVTYGDDRLQQVLVDKPSAPMSLMEKVTGVIRKISGSGGAPAPGTSSPSEGSSRRVSRNESERRRKISKISKDSSAPGSRRVSIQEFERRFSYSSGQQDWHGHVQLDPQYYGGNVTYLRPPSFAGSGRKISEESHVTVLSNHSDGCGTHSRRISLSTMQFPRDERKLSLEKTSLAQFLKALDAVHQRLKAPSSEPGSLDSLGSQTQYPPGSPQPIRSKNSSPLNRRRRVGICNPGFTLDLEPTDVVSDFMRRSSRGDKTKDPEIEEERL